MAAANNSMVQGVDKDLGQQPPLDAEHQKMHPTWPEERQHDDDAETRPRTDIKPSLSDKPNMRMWHESTDDRFSWWISQGGTDASRSSTGKESGDSKALLEDLNLTKDDAGCKDGTKPDESVYFGDQT